MNPRRLTFSCRPCFRPRLQALIPVLMSTRFSESKEMMKRTQTRLKPAVKKKRRLRLDANKKLSKLRRLRSARRKLRSIKNVKWRKNKGLHRKSRSEKPAKQNKQLRTRKNSKNKRSRSNGTKKKPEGSNCFVINKRKTTMTTRSSSLSRRTADSTLRVVIMVRWCKRPKS